MPKYAAAREQEEEHMAEEVGGALDCQVACGVMLVLEEPVRCENVYIHALFSHVWTSSVLGLSCSI